MTCASSRSSRWSPTRSAFAIAVSAGLTALLEDRPGRDGGVMAAQWAHQFLELGQQALMRLEVVVRLGQVDAAQAIHRHPVRRVRQVLGCDPEVDGMPGDVVERETRREPRSTASEDIPVGLTE